VPRSRELRVALITIPVDDEGFRSTAEALLSDDAHSPTVLERHLRTDYPAASVINGIEDRGMQRWYAYRDGHWVPSSAVPSRSAE
jgi:hypothetical protein